MSDEAIERLLQEVAGTRIGPLSVSIEGPDEGSWRISTAWYEAGGTDIVATLEGEAKVLRLERSVPTTVEREVWRPLLLGKPWVIDAAPATGGELDVRLWLHVQDLDMNTLLAALCELARLGELLPPPAPRAVPAAEVPLEVPSPAAMAPADVAEMAEAPEEAPPGPAPASEPEATPSHGPQPAAKHLPWEILSEAPPPSSPPNEEPVAPPPQPRPAMEAAVGDASLPAVFTQPEADGGPQPAGRAGYCKECGSPYAPDHVFCTNCGARLN